MARSARAVKRELIDNDSQELVLSRHAFPQDAYLISPPGRKTLKAGTKGAIVTIPFGRPGCLKRGARTAKFTIREDMVDMTRHEAQHAVVLYGGQVMTDLRHADYYVFGARDHLRADEIRLLCEGKIELLDEEAFYVLIRDGVPERKYLKDVELDSEGYCVGGADACRGYFGREDKDLLSCLAKRRGT